jgi:hypothetical protein
MLKLQNGYFVSVGSMLACGHYNDINSKVNCPSELPALTNELNGGFRSSRSTNTNAAAWQR